MHVCVRIFPWLPGMQSVCALLRCHVWPEGPYHVFPHYFINATIFGVEGGNLSNIKHAF